ncbi:MAG: DUF2171 domain-containing protein [Gemmataceae bacterium]
MDETDIREHMEVFSSDGQRVGVVEAVQGRRGRLTRYGSASGGRAHYIPLSWVAAVDWAVYLNKPCGEAKAEWEDAPPEGRG